MSQRNGDYERSTSSIIGDCFVTDSSTQQEPWQQLCTQENFGQLHPQQDNQQRKPFRVKTDYHNKRSSIQSNATTPSSASQEGPCFPAVLSSIIPSKTAAQQFCGTGGCDPCCDQTSINKGQTRSFMAANPPDSNSNPVIEALGVTPKSRDRINKYSTSISSSGSGSAMNSPGSSIPTPAPCKQKRYTGGVFNSKMKEKEVYWMNSLKESSTDEDAYLPVGFEGRKENENAAMYTEADLQRRVEEALKAQEQKLMETNASNNPAVRDLQQQMQQQLEQQGELWNKDLNEQVEMVRKNYKKKQSALKSRIQELEEQCQSMKQLHEKDREDQLKQAEILRWELAVLQKQNDNGINNTSNNEADITQKWKELETQNSMDSHHEHSVASEKGELVQTLEDKIHELQYQLEQRSMDQTNQGEKQLQDMEDHLKHLRSALSEQREERKSDKRKLSELEQEKDVLNKYINDLQEKLGRNKQRDLDTIELRQSFTSRERSLQQALEDETCEANKREEELKAKIQSLTSQLEETKERADYPYPGSSKEADLNAEIRKLSDLLQAADQSIQRANEETQKEVKARKEMELEVSKLTDLVNSLRKSSSPASGEALPTLHPSNSKNIDALDLMVIGGKDSKGIDAALSTDLVGPCCGTDVAFPCGEMAQQGRLLVAASSKSHTGGFSMEGERLLASVREQVNMLKEKYLKLSGGNAEKPSNDKSAGGDKEIHTIMQDIDEQLLQLQEDLSNDAKETDSVNRQLLHVEKEPSGPFGMQLLTKQLERQRAEIAQKEKERIDEMRRAQKLSDQLKSLEAQRGESSPFQSSNKEPISTNALHKEDEYAKQQAVLAQKEAEAAELAELLEEAKQKVKDLEDQIGRLQSNVSEKDKEISRKDKDLSRLRDQLKSVAKRSGAPIEGGTLMDEDAQVQELLVMLELKQKNEQLSDELENLKSTMEDKNKDEVDKLNEHLKGEKSQLEALEKEKNEVSQKLDALMHQIEETEEQQEASPASEKVLKGVGATILEKIEMVERHLSGTWEEFTKKKIAELTEQKQQLSDMKQKLEEYRQASETNEKGSSLLKSKVEDLEKELETERRKMKCKEVEIDELKQQLSKAKDEMSSTESKHADIVNELNKKLEGVKQLEIEKEELTKKVGNLETQVEKMENEKELEVEEFSETKKGLEQAKQECTKVKDELKNSKVCVASLQSKVSELDALLDSSRGECQKLNDMLQMKSSEYEQELLARTTELEEKSRATIAKCEQQVRQVREDHAKEIDELLAQLDLIEAEEKERCNEKELMVKEKDCVISALGHQLAESQNRLSSLEESLSEQKQELFRVEEEANTARTEANKLKTELKDLREQHSTLREEERIKREQACEGAREEMIQQAEAQFEQMNGLYRTLKKEYNNATAKVKQLESELECSKRDFEKAKDQHESKIVALNSALADLKNSTSIVYLFWILM